MTATFINSLVTLSQTGFSTQVLEAGVDVSFSRMYVRWAA